MQRLPMSVRDYLRRRLPARESVQRQLSFLGERLHDPELWHLTRHSTAGGLSVGLFMAFMPIPFQMLLAAPAAILLRVNLPIAAVSVWISNPLTMAPMIYAAYRTGAWLLNHPQRPFEFEFSWIWFTQTAVHSWQPLMLGMCAVG